MTLSNLRTKHKVLACLILSTLLSACGGSKNDTKTLENKGASSQVSGENNNTSNNNQENNQNVSDNNQNNNNSESNGNTSGNNGGNSNKDNQSPLLNITGDTKVIEQLPITLHANATDTDGEINHYSWSYDDELFSAEDIHAATLTITSNNILARVDTEVSLTVTDNQGAQTTATHYLTVEALANLAPTLEIIGPESVLEDKVFSLTADALDTDGHIASIQWQHDSALALSLDGTDSSVLTITTPNIFENQTVTFTASATDNQGIVNTTSHTVTIKALENIGAEVSINGPDQIEEKQSFTLQGTARDSDGGEIQSYQWSYAGELALTLDGAQTQTLTVNSPDIQENTRVTFKLEATDDQGLTTSTTHTVEISAITQQLTLAGKVTDQPIAYANVELTFDGQTFTTQADETGAYQLDIVYDESQTTALAQLRATGSYAQNNAHIEFISQLGDLAHLTQKAGEDKQLDANEEFGVNVTNITTSEFALIKRQVNQLSTVDELEKARKNVEPAEKMRLAKLIKAIVDHNVALPSNVKSTLELVQDEDSANTAITQLEEEQAELLAQIQTAIEQDSDLVKVAKTISAGDYYLSEAQFFNGFGLAVKLEANGTGFIANTKNSDFTWQKVNDTINIVFNEPTQLTGISLDLFGLSLNIIESQNNAHTVETVLLSNDAEQGPAPFIAKLAKKSAFIQPELDNLKGEWSLQLSQSDSPLKSLRLNFINDSQVELNNGTETMTASWGLIDNGQTIQINHPQSTLTLNIVREFKLGIQVLVNNGKVISGVMVRHQNIDFDDINHAKTWTPFKTKGDKQAFVVDEENNFHFNWQHNVKVENQQGKLTRNHYQFSEQDRAFCDVALAQCEITKSQTYELIASSSNLIAIQHTAFEHTSDSVVQVARSVHIYKLTNKPTNKPKQFDETFFSNTSTPHLFIGAVDLTAQNYFGTVNLRQIENCLSQAQSDCRSKIQYDDEIYWAEVADGHLKLTNTVSNAVLYLTIGKVNQEGLTICVNNVGCGPRSGDQFKFEWPHLNINIKQTGQGSIVPTVTAYEFGKDFELVLTPKENNELIYVRGCDGELIDEALNTSLFKITNPVENCEIEVEFSPRPVHLGETTVMMDSTDQFNVPLHFTFNISKDGRGIFKPEYEVRTFSKFPKFTIRKHSDTEYVATFDSIPTSIPINKQVSFDNNTQFIKIAGFKFTYEGEQLFISWLEYNNEGNHQYLEPIAVKTTKQITPMPLMDKLIGEWALSFDTYIDSESSNIQKNVSLTFNQDGTGSLNMGRYIAAHAEEKAFPFNWTLTPEGLVELTANNKTDYALLRVVSEHNGIHVLSIEQSSIALDDRQYYDWLRVGIGAFIKKADTPFSFEDIAGNLSDDWGDFTLYSDGIARRANLHGTEITTLKNNRLTVTATPTCTKTMNGCLLSFERDYELLAQNDQQFYVYRYVNNIRHLSVLNTDNTPTQISHRALMKANPSYFRSLRLFERSELGIDIWELTYAQEGFNLVTPVYTRNKEVVYTFDHEGMVKESTGEIVHFVPIESNSSGIWFCEIPKDGECSEQNKRFLEYAVPAHPITINVDGPGTVTSNLQNGTILHEHYLELTASAKESGFYVSSIEGCGLQYREHNARYLTYRASNLKSSCEVNIKVEAIPDSIADKIGVTDPTLKACIDNYKHYSPTFLLYGKALDCKGNEENETVNDLTGLSNFVNLSILRFNSMDVTLDNKAISELSKLSRLQTLSIQSSLTTDVDMSSLQRLRSFYLRGQNTRDLTLTPAPNLAHVGIDSSVLESFVLSDATKLKSLSVSGGKLKAIDLSQAQSLETLRLKQSIIDTLDLTHNTVLKAVDISQSEIAQIAGVTPSHALADLDARLSKLTSLDLSQYAQLQALNIAQNQFTTLDITKAEKLKKLFINNNPMTSLATAQGSQLEMLNIDDTQIDTLNTQHLLNLRSLSADNTKLTELQLAGLRELTWLSASNNTLTELDLSDTEKLWNIYFKNNTLQSIIPGPNTDITLHLESTQVSKKAQAVIDQQGYKIRN
ncbi:PKD domain-containing protein [Pseudoalteromonas luteoviolacea]|uniref:PKD/Chitinase domain-containing protein n=2 Tax=Pseudoalteromonas luteoviolacea TaxID=43657 RepID=A0A0F6ADZ3_9GAMM|nr:hypothetical protein [Pseudoalteromonas luteoviolacea]AOT08820.1 hypothetical protein S4054249_13575 [Pseudoalteromonas luteoviolacea]AOT13733.1 hypothetical protein S40542_13545 [Pseudoalteromonas luteoviolacea]AOT18647.1 hypothetical protein S4054_13550 [Pseudoalteromonas luteoviolacea]KKE83619.1 hypothetical protein N479_13240 [Pseudoalteromonas luteoviolacea S4054]KZN72808.1 hypothetical protein N481_14375 [Pseudoalteromonas luteoviolacea S4047-1]